MLQVFSYVFDTLGLLHCHFVLLLHFFVFILSTHSSGQAPQVGLQFSLTGELSQFFFLFCFLQTDFFQLFWH